MQGCHAGGPEPPAGDSAASRAVRGDLDDTLSSATDPSAGRVLGTPITDRRLPVPLPDVADAAPTRPGLCGAPPRDGLADAGRTGFAGAAALPPACTSANGATTALLPP
jgi:hypothetical protein